jgi:hypothetical protein
MAPVFVVTVETVDYHNDPSGASVWTEVRGVHTTKAGANASAKGLLLSEWDRDFFETYEESKDEKGNVAIEALCPEGETMKVEVSEHVLQESDGKEEGDKEEEEEEDKKEVIKKKQKTSSRRSKRAR